MVQDLAANTTRLDNWVFEHVLDALHSPTFVEQVHIQCWISLCPSYAFISIS